jgi:TPR repeat protein
MKQTKFLSTALAAILAALFAVSCNKPPTQQQKDMMKVAAQPRTEIDKLKAAVKAEAENLKKGQTNELLEATVKLAKIYENGSEELDVAVDFYLAGLLYKRAATNGNAFAQNRIGRLYEVGDSTTITRNLSRSAHWYRMAADQGYRDAETNLGYLYEKGSGVPRDYIEAGKWYLKAAEKGEPVAQYRLGLLYELGKGVSRNDSDASKWILLAAENGYDVAQFKAATMYFDGQGVEKDLVEAMRWYESAARQGHIKAQTRIGLLYFSGKGVAKDNVEAYKWLNIAAATEDPEAGRHREMVAESMTPEKIRFAQERAAEFTVEIVQLDAARPLDDLE